MPLMLIGVDEILLTLATNLKLYTPECAFIDAAGNMLVKIPASTRVREDFCRVKIKKDTIKFENMSSLCTTYAKVNVDGQLLALAVLAVEGLADLERVRRVAHNVKIDMNDFMVEAHGRIRGIRFELKLLKQDKGYKLVEASFESRGAVLDIYTRPSVEIRGLILKARCTKINVSKRELLATLELLRKGSTLLLMLTRHSGELQRLFSGMGELLKVIIPYAGQG